MTLLMSLPASVKMALLADLTPWACRSTELRLACSPDQEAHMVIREPAQCLYIITLYIPGLCQVQSTKATNHKQHDDL